MRKRTGRAGTAGRGGSAAGFSLVELLVVVAIIGILAMIAIAQVGAAFKRQRLASSAYDLKPFVQRVKAEGETRNAISFLRVAPPNADGTIPVQVIVDTNGNSQLDVGTDTMVREILVPAELALTSPAPAGITGGTTWDQWVARATDDHYAGSDFIGRTINPVTGVQVIRPLRLELTHDDMVSGGLTPQVTWTLTVNPVWNAALAQRLGP